MEPSDRRHAAYGRSVTRRALVTNDDGIDSPGLWTLASAARAAGLDVVVAAPHRDASGVGASVWSARSVAGTRLHRREIDALPGVPAYGVEGHPAFIVHAAGRGWLDPAPDIVLSGVNLGANVGHAIVHSGTVGAVLAGGLHGWRGLAVSLDSGWVPPPHPRWEAAAHVLPEVLDLLLRTDPGTMLSLNVPHLPSDEIGELREARLAPFGVATMRMDTATDGDGEVLRATAEMLAEPPEEGTDVALLAAGHPALTRLRSVSALPGLFSGV